MPRSGSACPRSRRPPPPHRRRELAAGATTRSSRRRDAAPDRRPAAARKRSSAAPTRARWQLDVPDLGPAHGWASSPRSADRIATRGAGRPVQRSKPAAPWNRSTSRPSTTTSQPALPGRCDEGRLASVGEIGEVDDLHAAVRAHDQLLLDGRRVDQDVVVDRRGRPVRLATARRRHPEAPARSSASTTARAAPPRSEHQDAPAVRRRAARKPRHRRSTSRRGGPPRRRACSPTLPPARCR